MKDYFKKQFGQNFLTNRAYAKKLVKSADVKDDDIVVEIGAGAGMVTQYLVSIARKVFAVEIDKRFVKLLMSRFKEELNSKKLVIVNEDILKLEVNRLKLKVGEYKVIGSLPYNISKKIIRKFFEEEIQPESVSIIIQKEVAEDYAAKPPKATFLSNYVRLFSNVEFVEVVPKEFFNPEPKVDGAIIRFKIKDFRLKNRNRFIRFLKSAFLNPRKKLINNLSGIYKKEKSELVKLFEKIGIEVNARASNLKLGQWRKLAVGLKVSISST
jgi:16S rRNA (adenine1518-N6/adenine1519-N6)-dimethyltransferase